MTSAGATARTIYVVDDNEAMRQSLGLLLTLLGWRPVTFRDGRACLDALLAPGAARPDCLIVDLTMPRMGGVMLIERLEAHGIHAPVIVITGEPETAAAGQARAAGARYVLAKPFSSQDLVFALELVALRARGAPPRPAPVAGLRQKQH